ncbi:unnamed protein product [Cladocopium goreaui]|uniref:Uncharacterized protein n=1 Tax=Cladocopium goreaui TaxID=2562237 RepID=A0A9P1GFB9_9DINO|nr:unnamed protein product [Cladocopium goreaui]
MFETELVELRGTSLKERSRLSQHLADMEKTTHDKLEDLREEEIANTSSSTPCSCETATSWFKIFMKEKGFQESCADCSAQPLSEEFGRCLAAREGASSASSSKGKESIWWHWGPRFVELA